MAFITVFVVYGGIMNFAAWLMDHAMSPQNSALTKEELLMVYAAGVPYDSYPRRNNGSLHFAVWTIP